jgi:RimJ/RimL family protein N-acetyltransferase
VKAPLLFVGGTLVTPGLALEPLTPAHAPLMFEGFADPALYRWINAEPPVSVDDLSLRFERIANPYAPGGELWLNWAVRRTTAKGRPEREGDPTSDNAYAGLVEATVRSDRVVFLAFYVFTAFARQGIAREACTAVIEHLWRSYDAAEVRADIDFRNVPSRCLVESLGFARRTRNIVTTLRGAPSVDYRYRLKRPGPAIR